MHIPHELSVRAIKCGLFIAKDTTMTRLVRRIQHCEGDTPCFRTDIGKRCKGNCEWEEKCKNSLVAHWLR